MDTSYLSLLSQNCPKCVVVFFFRRGLPQVQTGRRPRASKARLASKEWNCKN